METEKDWILSVGFFNGLLIGSRTYEYEGKESSDVDYVIDYVLYLGFIQIILTNINSTRNGE